MSDQSRSNVLRLRTRLSRRETRKMAAFASMASIVLIVTMANTSLLTKGPKTQSSFQQGGRMIASVENFLEPNAKQGWLKAYIESRQKPQDRAVASLGTTPSVMDELRFGVLEGKYALRIQAGRLSQIEFIETVEDRPKYIQDKVAFLEKYKGLFKVSFSKVVPGQNQQNGDLQEQTFDLVEGSAVSASVKFVSDSSGRLLALDVNSKE